MVNLKRKIKPSAEERTLIDKRVASRNGTLIPEDFDGELSEPYQYAKNFADAMDKAGRVNDKERRTLLGLLQSIVLHPQQVGRLFEVSDASNWELAAYLRNIPMAFARHPVASSVTALSAGAIALILLMTFGMASVEFFSPSVRRPAIQNPIGGLRR